MAKFDFCLYDFFIQKLYEPGWDPHIYYVLRTSSKLKYRISHHFIRNFDGNSILNLFFVDVFKNRKNLFWNNFSSFLASFSSVAPLFTCIWIALWITISNIHGLFIGKFCRINREFENIDKEKTWLFTILMNLNWHFNQTFQFIIFMFYQLAWSNLWIGFASKLQSIAVTRATIVQKFYYGMSITSLTDNRRISPT